MKIAKIDRRGRIVIPRAIRFESRIQTPSKLVVGVEGPGKISLQSIETNSREAQQIGRRKLPGWKEEKHEEDRLALKLADRKGAIHKTTSRGLLEGRDRDYGSNSQRSKED